MLQVYWVPLVFIGLLGFVLIYLHGKRHPVIGSKGFRLSTGFFIVALAASLLAELIVYYLLATEHNWKLGNIEVINPGDSRYVIIFASLVIYASVIISMIALYLSLMHVRFLIPDKSDAVSQFDIVKGLISSIFAANFKTPRWSFFLGYSFINPDLEKIREKCLTIHNRWKSVEVGEYLAKEGIEKLRAVLQELESNGQES